MTKGEYPLCSDQQKESKDKHDDTVPMQEKLGQTVIFRGYDIRNKNICLDENYIINHEHKQIAEAFGINNKEIKPVSFTKEPLLVDNNVDNTGQSIDIAEYVQQMQNADVKRKLARLLSQGLEESEIDIENIDHYLVVAYSTNSNSTLQSCENKLIKNMNQCNYKDFGILADHYDLPNLREHASIFMQDKSENISCRNGTHAIGHKLTNTRPEKSYPRRCHESYYAIFTCGQCKNKRTVTVMLYDVSLKLKVVKNIQKDACISKQFQCCCLQADDDIEPYVFWCFGKSLYRYDPVILKRKKKASLNCKRSKFSLVTVSQKCFVIGGEYQMHRVYEIEEYNCFKNKWKKVAMLPRECLPIGCSCVVFNNNVYIFSAMVDDSNEIKRQSTGVYVFHPVLKTVKMVAEIPFWFNQIKSCVLESFIYLASDKGLFIKFDPTDCYFKRCQDQILACRDFGMFASDGAVICVGGKSADASCNDIFRRFSSSSETWDILPTALPDSMTICGVCELKVPKSVGALVPFYDKNIFGK